jgi:hypothetical protein
MTIYTYHITYRSRTGAFKRVGMNTEALMFDAAVQVDREGGELLSAVREVWEVREGHAHFLRFEPYRNGKPQAA